MVEGDEGDKREINKDLLSLNFKDKYNANTNLISANEHDYLCSCTNKDLARVNKFADEVN